MAWEVEGPQRRRSFVIAVLEGVLNRESSKYAKADVVFGDSVDGNPCIAGQSHTYHTKKVCVLQSLAILR